LKTTHTISVLMLIAATVLGGCASNNQQPSYSTSSRSNDRNYGSIESIQVTRADNNHSSGAGAVIGGVVGGLLGHQVGGGSGNTAATIVGAVGGAVVGNNVEKNKNAQSQDMYQIQVRLDNGDSMAVVQDSVYDLRVGNRVRIVEGRVYRY
jgi:outer membrane lipoprotein SlyB